MKREIYKNLKSWKDKPDDIRKPLILEGARQTGKTWIVHEFGKNEFENIVSINFEDAEQLRDLFEIDFDINRIILSLQAFSHKAIVPHKTLLFFDEVQVARRGLLALKYFKEKAPQYHIIAAGSLLGVIDHKNDSFPVGKVEFLQMYPLSFKEFLMAMGKEGMISLLDSGDWKAITAFENQFIHLLSQYYFVGGMPEVVKTFIEQNDYKAVRKVQEQLLKSYADDFSKHPPKEIAKRMLLLWNSIPSQLAKENKRFVYSALRGSARAKDFETSIEWLQDVGLIYKVTRVVSGEIPLAGFEEPDIFKLYMLDIGLLGAMLQLDEETMLLGSQYFGQYKGAFTEQFVLQEMKTLSNVPMYYWSPEASIAEVDFVVQCKSQVIPIEVKAERNLRAKSLGLFVNKYSTKTAVRTSLQAYEEGYKIVDVPLYGFAWYFASLL